MLVYANADMLFTDELRRALTFALDEMPAVRRGRALFVVGKRYDSNRFAATMLDFDAKGVDDDGGDKWQAAVRAAAHRIPSDFKHNDNRWAIDYFAWTRGYFGKDVAKSSFVILTCILLKCVFFC